MKDNIPFDEIRSRYRAVLKVYDIIPCTVYDYSISIHHSFLTWGSKESSRIPVT